MKTNGCKKLIRDCTQLEPEKQEISFETAIKEEAFLLMNQISFTFSSIFYSQRDSAFEFFDTSVKKDKHITRV